jgi:hypothetical protein
MKAYDVDSMHFYYVGGETISEEYPRYKNEVPKGPYGAPFNVNSNGRATAFKGGYSKGVMENNDGSLRFTGHAEMDYRWLEHVNVVTIELD